MIATLARLVAGAAVAALVPAGAQSFPGTWSAKAPLPAAHSEVAVAVAGCAISCGGKGFTDEVRAFHF